MKTVSSIPKGKGKPPPILEFGKGAQTTSDYFFVENFDSTGQIGINQANVFQLSSNSQAPQGVL